jgi:ABC-type phosphate transport system permease subunit
MSKKNYKRKNKTVIQLLKQRRHSFFVLLFALLLIGIITTIIVFLFYRPSKIVEPVAVKEATFRRKVATVELVF